MGIRIMYLLDIGVQSVEWSAGLRGNQGFIEDD